MTGSNGPDRDDPALGGSERRPHATLELKAEEVSAKSGGADSEAEPASAAEAPADPPALDAPAADEIPPRAGDGGGQGIFTHMAAGALGALLALVFSYFVFAGQRAAPALSPDDVQTLRARLAAFEGRLNDAVARTEQLSASGPSNLLRNDVAALTERVGRIEARPAGAPASQDAVQQALEPLAARVTELEQRIGAVAKAQSDVQTNSKATALAVALYNLRRAANEGKPYATELQSIADMTPVPLDLDPLQARRDEGVRSLEQLQASFDAAANAAIDAENKPSDDSFASGLWSKAKSFIRVRRKGDVLGDDTRAILARVEHRLAAGDLPAAAAEAGQLHGPAATAMVRWIGELKVKLATDEALARVEAKLLTALGGDEQAKRGG